MSEQNTPFDHRPDLVLGGALRAALAPRGRAEFVARVLAAADRQAGSLVDVLARWSRLGIAAALLAALAATLVAGRGSRGAESVVDDADPEAVVAGVQAPEVGVLFASYSDR
jgi:anti-sigma factor RsiW